jgi:hypothetical protein
VVDAQGQATIGHCERQNRRDRWLLGLKSSTQKTLVHGDVEKCAQTFRKGGHDRAREIDLPIEGHEQLGFRDGGRYLQRGWHVSGKVHER